MIIHAPVPVVRLSMVIPALNEAEALPGTLRSLERQEADPPFEVILADGGSRDGTIPLFQEMTRDWPHGQRSAQVVACPRPGRGEQMNAGAGVAKGDALVFLHADTQLGSGATRAILRALSDPEVIGGGFRHSFSDAGPVLRVISLYATARSLLRGIHYGDQAIFARRSVFEAIGGFTREPLFEDLELSRRLRKRGRVVTLPMAVSTSARRLRQGGIVRTAARFAWLKVRHAFGADPSRLKARYPDVR
ncbi:MAG TPA: TIGR04283 family arsenosugar biosynthesis glycosyltransferase [Candidatus Polarisedimenticolia bacterium]|jgi:rSAM/selenodomain-associated transferase 2|nr:TIGR04283 family arsenosugar biosynthesis glycosyltransferase [Candidatus Polarisedimenticolia bacterium]